MQSDFSRMKNLSEHEKTSHRCRCRFCRNPVFILLFSHPFCHRFGAAYQAGILSAANRAEMADVEQMKIPFVTCEITFGKMSAS